LSDLPAGWVAMRNLRRDGWKFDFLLMHGYDEIRNNIS
jgi:hypothetical protein